MSKVPQRGEIWQRNDNNDLFYVVAVHKFSIKCITLEKGQFNIFSINKYDFIIHRHFVANSKHDIEDLFKTENE